MIWRLYEVENRVRPLDDERDVQCAEGSDADLGAAPRGIGSLVIEAVAQVGAAQAVTYASNQWQALCRYTEDGRLTIDNNMSERRVRDQAIGRKNWMFLGSVEAGPRAAVLCTILAGAKRHRLEPWAYLHDVILQLAVDASPEFLAGLLPDRWCIAHPEHILTYRLEESRQKAQRRDQRRAQRSRPK